MGFLKENDLIDIVAPAASYINYDPTKVIDFIEKLGFKARLPKELQKYGADDFSAHNLSTRLNNFKEAMLAPDSKALWCFRGGYGSTKLIPQLEEIDFSSVKKPIIGFSDITALHIYFSNKYNLQTIHARTLSEYLHKEVSQDEVNKLKNLLLGKNYGLQITALNNLAKTIPQIRAKIIGGNLVLIECSLGTKWQINTKDKILVIEDAFERGYRIARSLEHLKQAGVFINAKAVIIGDIKCDPEPDGSFKCDQAITSFAQELELPVYKTPNIGHGIVNNPLIFGKEYILTNNQQIILRPQDD